MGSLKTFIKSVRKAKTIADERAVIRKESAAIRTAFRDPQLDHTSRRINISKLLYLYIMGEKTHFGQVECLKLLASPRFADKRLGYLATMLLLDENQEVITLLTNSLDNDMQHPNAFVVGLALCCLGNLASPELARDLYTNVDKILLATKTTNISYLKKKAAIVAAKLVEKDPDLADIFLPRVHALINENQSRILLGASRLIQALYLQPGTRPTLVKTVPTIIAHLKRISTLGYMPEFDVFGINDPFVQASLLATLRTLAVDENCPPEYLDEVNDILTQVASNLESGKNAAHAILYECVKTIFAIQLDQSLKILGVNILGKFLSTKDNNTRYVALDTLLTVINIEPLAVQRHRQTIVSCLSDGDISIRRRALELSFAILNDQNIRVLAREILSFLENCTDNELKPFITSQLTIAASKYAPNAKWHFDTLIRMLTVSDNFITPDIISNILALIMQCDLGDLKKHIVLKLYQAASEDPSQFGLALITVWTLGEYADLVLGESVDVHSKPAQVTEDAIIALLNQWIDNSTYSEAETVQLVTYILTAVLKLSVKFTQSSSIEALRLLLNSRSYDTNLEIQVRAIEYQEIFAQNAKLKSGLLARMPAPPVKQRELVSLNGGATKKAVVPTSAGDDLLDLDAGATNNDLLSDIFGSQPSEPKKATNDDILGLFDAPAPAASVEASAIPAFSNSHISVAFIPKTFADGHAVVEAIVQPTSTLAIEQFQLLCAVPKTQKLTISSTLGDSLSQGGLIKQVLKIAGKPGAKVKLRVKVRYTADGHHVEDLFDFGGFPTTL